MRIPCPYCGERDLHEFVCRGEAKGARPDPAGPGAPSFFLDYVHGRENPLGEVREHWYHAVGCRGWLVVTRDTRSHAIRAVAPAAPEAPPKAEAGPPHD